MISAIENLVIPMEELAMKSVNASSEQELASVLLDLDQREFPRDIEGKQLTASRKKYLHTDLKEIDETVGKITVDRGDLLLVDERNFDQQPHTHHMVRGQNGPQESSESFLGLLPAQHESTLPQHMLSQLTRDTAFFISIGNHK